MNPDEPMQAPPEPPSTPSPPPAEAVPPRRGGPWGKILGFGCAGCLVLTLLLAGVGAGVLVAVFRKTPLPASQAHYVGTWVCPDENATLTIRQNGSADLFIGAGAQFRITNGQVTIDEANRTLKVRLFGIERSFQIDEPPQPGGDRMVLAGREYRRTTGAAYTDIPDSVRTAPPPAAPEPALVTGELSFASDDIPAEMDQKALVRESLLAFNEAVQSGDFTTLHSRISRLWQAQITPAQLQETFQSFIDNDIDISGIASAEPVLSPPAVKEDGVLRIEGTYGLSGQTVEFRLSYVFEDPHWRLMGIRINVR